MLLREEIFHRDLLFRNEFPEENFSDIVAEYGKHEGDYLEYLSQRVAQYQAWKKDGHMEELKQNVRKKILRLTNPEEYDLLLENEEKKHEQSKRKGFKR